MKFDLEKRDDNFWNFQDLVSINNLGAKLAPSNP